MKTYDEMAKYVLEVRDEHEKKRKRKIYIAKRAVPAIAGVFASFVIGLGIRNNFRKPDTFPTPDNVVGSVATTAASTALPQTTAIKTTTLTTTAVITNTSAAQTQNRTETTAAAFATTALRTQQTTANGAASAAASTAVTTTSALTRTTALQTAPTSQPTVTTIVPGEIPTAGGTDGGYGGEETGGTDAGGVIIGGGGVPSTGETGGGSAPDPWYSLPIDQAFYYAFVDGHEKTYRNGYRISSDYIGDSIGRARMESRYPVDGELKCYDAEAFCLDNYSGNDAVAIQFMGDGKYYLYLTDDTDINDLMKQIPPLE